MTFYGESLYGEGLYGDASINISADIEAISNVVVSENSSKEITTSSIAISSLQASAKIAASLQATAALTSSAQVEKEISCSITEGQIGAYYGRSLYNKSLYGSQPPKAYVSVKAELLRKTSVALDSTSGLSPGYWLRDIRPISIVGYGRSLYNQSYYGALPFRHGTELPCKIVARIVKPFVEPPPIMDTLAYGLAQRFNWLQEGIQVFGLFNKIEYVRGQDLDDHWGKIYDLPRMTAETDDHYRIRLQTYLKVLTGSGTIPNTREVLDFLISQSGATEISTLWPARIIINFNTIEAMKAARARASLLNSILPGMFAAGITYEIMLPFLEYCIKAAIFGPRTIDYNIRAAIQTERELSCGIDALIAFGVELPHYIKAATRAQRELHPKALAALRADRSLSMSQRAAIQGSPSLVVEMYAAMQGERSMSYNQRAAIKTERSLSMNQKAAVQRTFELLSNITAFIVYLRSLDHHVRAAIQTERELTCKIRARVKAP